MQLARRSYPNRLITGIEMINLLKIHEFAQKAGVTTRLLRHYDSLGLFKPAKIDRENGYRYYSLDQLEMLHRIMALRALGLPLGQIADILKSQLTTDDIANVLQSQQIHIERAITRDIARLKEVETRLEALKNANPYQDIVIKSLPPIQGLHIYVELVAGENPSMLFQQIAYTLHSQGLYKHVEAIIGIYPFHPMTFNNPAQYANQPFRFQAMYAMPIATLKPISIGANRMLKPLKLVSVAQAACLLHIGSYQTLFNSYRNAFAHLKAYGYQVCDAPREIYLQEATDQQQGITEIQIPIAPYGSLPEYVPT